MSNAAEGRCWLCGQWRRLTREHIPPRSAFNNRPLLLLEVSKRSHETGVLHWASRREEGLIARSLCGECNSWSGAKYGTHYAEFVANLADLVEKAHDGARIYLCGVRRPLSILKQVLQCFVSANGAEFVHKNAWVRRFLRNSRNQEWPSDTFAYLFATNSRGGRKSGVAGYIDFSQHKTRVVSEFTFWPLGTVLSFWEPLDDRRLTPIHHWTKYDYGYSGRIDISLTVNPVASAYPVDFRDRSTVEKDAMEPSAALLCHGDDMNRMIASTLHKAGKRNSDRYALVARKRPRLIPSL